jgi:hypothetical protein
MAAPTAEQLAAIESRLRAILVPYENRMEWATIYGNATLRRAGAKGHEWFAFVKPQAKHIGFYLLPMHTWPALREWLSPALAKRLTGASAFTFPNYDETLFVELEGVVARAYDAYMGEGSGPTTRA